MWLLSESHNAVMSLGGISGADGDISKGELEVFLDLMGEYRGYVRPTKKGVPKT